MLDADAIVDNSKDSSMLTRRDVVATTAALAAAAQSRAAAPKPMELGNFSVSLTVKNLAASKEFYEKLGFRQFAGVAAKNWVVMKNGDCIIGLFQGMFEKNMLSFNPGWDKNAQKLTTPFTDVRELQRQLKAQGVQPLKEADETSTGPASFVVVDPDGNPILIDQFV